MTKEELVAYLKNKQVKLCVFSSANAKGDIWPAVMAYALSDDGEILLSTQKTTGKYQNVKENKNAALAIGFDFTDPAVQCSGTAEILEEGGQFRNKLDFFFSVNPQAAKFRSDETILIIFRPEFIKVTDLSSHPPKSDQFDSLS